MTESRFEFRTFDFDTMKKANNRIINAKIREKNTRNYG
jgi:hypothetical protein